MQWNIRNFASFLLCLFILVACRPSTPAALPAILTAMSPVAKGQGVPEAAIYNPEWGETHRLVLLSTSGAPHEWNASLPTAWLPSSIGETDLVVIVSPEQEAVWEQKFYRGNGPSTQVTSYRMEITLQVREARSGQTLIDGVVLQGPEPHPLPAQVSVGTTRFDGEHVKPDVIVEWLQCQLIMPQDCEGQVRVLEENTEGVRSVVFSSDGKILASASVFGEVKLWRSSDGVLLQAMQQVDIGAINRVIFSPDNQIAIWRVTDGVLLRTLGIPGTLIAYSPDGEILVSESGGIDSRVQFWQVSDGALVRTLKVSDNAIALSPDQKILASVLDGKISLQRVSDGSPLLTLDWPNEADNLKLKKGVALLAFSPDGQLVVAAFHNYELILWRISDGSPLQTLKGHTGHVVTLVHAGINRLVVVLR